MDEKEYKTASEYGHELIEVAHRMKRMIMSNTGKRELYHGEFMMLGVIDSIIECNLKEGIDEPGAKVGEISKRLRATKSATSKMLRALEDKNYIERATDKKDRRTVFIRLTEEGDKLITEHKQKMNIFICEVIEELGIEKMDVLIKTLDSLHNIMAVKIDNYFQKKSSEE